MSENIDHITRDMSGYNSESVSSYPIDDFSQKISKALGLSKSSVNYFREEQSKERIKRAELRLQRRNKYSNATIEIITPIASLEGDEDKKNEIIDSIADEYQALANRLENKTKVHPPNFSSQLPKKAPILYKEWKDNPKNKGKTPIDCLHEVYGEYLRLNILFQDDLNGKKGLDPTLIKAITNYLKVDISTKIPPKTQKIDKLIKIIGPDNLKEYNNLYSIYRKR